MHISAYFREFICDMIGLIINHAIVLLSKKMFDWTVKKKDQCFT